MGLLRKIFNIENIKSQLRNPKHVSILLGGIFIAFLGIIIIQNQIKGASANWWNESWFYRQSVTLPDHSSEESNVYFQISLDTASLITAEKMQSDCGDIRFTTFNGINMPYYIVSGCNTSNTVVNILFDTYPAGVVTIYMYYGNTSTSNGSVSSNFNASAASNGTTTVSYQVNASANDGDVNTNGVSGNITRTGLRVGNDSNAKIMAARFTSVAIPQGTSLISATFTGTSRETYNCGGCTLTSTIYGEDVDNSAILTTGNISSRTRTTASTSAGSLTSTVLDTEYNFTVTTQVQEIIDRGGWSSGNALSILFVDSTSTSNEWQEFFSYDGDPAKAPELSVTYGGGSASFGSEEVTPGPVAYWKFDEGQGSTAYDSIGSNNGTLASGTGSPTWASADQCVSEKCMLFDGTHDYVTVTDQNSLDITSAFTITGWIKVRELTGVQRLVAKETPNGSAGANSYGFGILSSGKLRFTVFNVADVDDTGQNAVQANKWHYIAVSHTGTSYNFYIDGKLNSTITNANNPTANSHPLLIGRRSTSSEYLKGYADDIKIYMYGRTAAQIKADYASRGTTKGTSAQFGDDDMNRRLSDGLVGYWKIDENTGTTTADLSGNSNTGSLGSGTAAPTWTGGKFGSGLDFDGSNDFVNTTYDSSYTTGNSFAFSAWFKTSVSTTTHTIIGAENEGADPDGAIALQMLNTGVIDFSIRSDVATGGSSIDTVASTASYDDGNWHHIVANYNQTSSLITLDIDGNQVATAPLDNSMALKDLANIPFYIGARNFDAVSVINFFNGDIDEVRIYNRALDPSEIKALYEFAPAPIGYWKMDEGNGSTAADFSGNGNNGTFATGNSAPSWSTGKFGNALNFDGINDYINISNTAPLNPTTALTFSMWINPSRAPTSYYPIGGMSFSGFARGYLFDMHTGGVTFQVGDGAWSAVTDPVIPPSGQWTHIAGTWDGSNVRLYVNGILKDSDTQNTIIYSSTVLDFGRYGLGTGPFYPGRIDDVKIYNYARTQEQIINDMNAGHPAPGSPVGSALLHFKMDEGYGTTVNNAGNAGSTLNGTFGTGNSAPSWTNDGKYGRATTFDGSGDRIDLSTTIQFDSNDFSISGWFKTSASGILQQIWNSGYNGGSSDVEVFINNTDDTLRFYVRGDNGTEIPSSNLLSHSAVNDDKWHHFVVTRNGNVFSLYVDGTEHASFTRTITDVDSASVAPRIGNGLNNISNRGFKGSIDEIKVYNLGFDASQVKVEFNQGKAQVMGAGSTGIGGTGSSFSASREYCVPGDSSTCNAPVGEWNFNNIIGNTAPDTSGNNNSGMLTGGPIEARGKFGKSVQFDGTNDYIAVADPGASSVLDFSNGSSITLSAWFKPAILPTDGNFQTIITKGLTDGVGDDLNYGMFWGRTSGRLALDLCYTNTSDQYHCYLTTPALSINVGQWHHAAVTYTFGTGSSARIYFNGNLIPATWDNSGNDAPNVTNEPLWIGADNYLSSVVELMHGQIDNVRIYNYARTPAQVAWEYNRGAPVAYYKMDECTGSTIKDWSQNANGGFNGNNGTLELGASGETSAGTCSTSGAWADGVSGKFESSMSFDGSSDYIEIDDNSFLDLVEDDDMSLSFWMKPSTLSTAKAIISKKTSNAAGANGFMIHTFNGGTMGFYLADSTTTNQVLITTTSSLTVGQWTHVTITYDAKTNPLIYFNGKRQTTSSSGGGTIGTMGDLSNGSPLVLGAESDFHLPYYGQLDEVKFFRYALTPAQIKTEMAGGAVRFQ